MKTNKEWDSLDKDFKEIFCYSFRMGLGKFRMLGPVCIEQFNQFIKISQKKPGIKRHTGLTQTFRFRPATVYQITLIGRAIGNDTGVNLKVFNKRWKKSGVKILKKKQLPVSNEFGEGFVVFKTPSHYYDCYNLAITLCNCFSVHRKVAYLQGIKIYEIEGLKPENEFSSVHFNMNSSQNSLEKVMKFTLPGNSPLSIKDTIVQTAYIDRYIAVEVNKGNDNKDSSSIIYHLPLYKLDQNISEVPEESFAEYEESTLGNGGTSSSILLNEELTLVNSSCGDSEIFQKFQPIGFNRWL